jgi:formiminotetrahydrofolate cyclodeaminase
MDPLEESVSDVLRATGRKSPQLGGGAASILSALIGLSLLRMAAATTADKAGSEVTASRVPASLGEIDDLSKRLEHLVRADVDVFSKYVLALRLPHETQGEEIAREMVLDETGAEAAETPLEAASFIVEGLEIAARIAPHIGPEVSSDIYAGAAVLNGALFGSIATLDINLKPRRMAGRREGLLGVREKVLARQKAAMAGIVRQAEKDGYLLS